MRSSVAAFEQWSVPEGTRPHDVAPGHDGRVWYTGQGTGEMGVLDPATGQIERIDLRTGAAPHGVIVAPDGTVWVTEGGLNALVAVAPDTHEVTTFPLPRPAFANLNTAAFDRDGLLWFTGQGGVYESLDPTTGTVAVFDVLPEGGGARRIWSDSAGRLPAPRSASCSDARGRSGAPVPRPTRCSSCGPIDTRPRGNPGPVSGGRRVGSA